VHVVFDLGRHVEVDHVLGVEVEWGEGLGLIKAGLSIRV
jgi:hypothetical protein